MYVKRAATAGPADYPGVANVVAGITFAYGSLTGVYPSTLTTQTAQYNADALLLDAVKDKLQKGTTVLGVTGTLASVVVGDDGTLYNRGMLDSIANFYADGVLSAGGGRSSLDYAMMIAGGNISSVYLSAASPVGGGQLPANRILDTQDGGTLPAASVLVAAGGSYVPDFPAVGNVLDSDTVNGSAGTFNEGNRNTDPGEANVKSGTSYKIANVTKNGTVTEASVADVLKDKQYGAGGTAHTGTLSGIIFYTAPDSVTIVSLGVSVEDEVGLVGLTAVITVNATDCTALTGLPDIEGTAISTLNGSGCGFTNTDQLLKDIATSVAANSTTGGTFDVSGGTSKAPTGTMATTGTLSPNIVATGWAANGAVNGRPSWKKTISAADWYLAWDGATWWWVSDTPGEDGESGYWTRGAPGVPWGAYTPDGVIATGTLTVTPTAGSGWEAAKAIIAATNTLTFNWTDPA